MAKNLTVTWLGDEDPQRQIVQEGGLTFVKGQAVKVPSDHTYVGIPWGDNFKGNPMFSVDEDVDTIDADEEAERDAIKQQLDDKSVKYRQNASLDALRKLLADNTPPADPEPVVA